MGRHIGWEVMRGAMERASGHDLAPFFQQWVRQGGAPRLELVAADWQPGEKSVRITLRQGETAFALEVPLRLHYGERWVDAVVAIDQSRQQVEVPCETSGLTAIELDPDYHLFRKLRPEQMLPTSALTRRALRLVIVLPEGDVAAPYRAVADSYSRAVLGEDPSKPAADREVIERTASTLEPADLVEAGLLVLGDGVHAPAVQELLGRTRSPVRWVEAGFQVDDRQHAAAGEAVYFTVHHPERPGQGITVYYGNSEQALANAGLLNFYPNSLLVFEIPAAVEGSDAPRAKVIERIDFEGHDRIDF